MRGRDPPGISTNIPRGGFAVLGLLPEEAAFDEGVRRFVDFIGHAVGPVMVEFEDLTHLGAGQRLASDEFFGKALDRLPVLAQHLFEIGRRSSSKGRTSSQQASSPDARRLRALHWIRPSPRAWTIISATILQAPRRRRFSIASTPAKSWPRSVTRKTPSLGVPLCSQSPRRSRPGSGPVRETRRQRVPGLVVGGEPFGGDHARLTGGPNRPWWPRSSPRPTGS